TMVPFGSRLSLISSFTSSKSEARNSLCLIKQIPPVREACIRYVLLLCPAYGTVFLYWQTLWMTSYLSVPVWSGMCWWIHTAIHIPLSCLQSLRQFSALLSQSINRNLCLQCCFPVWRFPVQRERRQG